MRHGKENIAPTEHWDALASLPSVTTPVRVFDIGVLRRT
jgi:hypothetical protein